MLQVSLFFYKILYGLVATIVPLDIKLHPVSTQVENSLAYHIPPSSCDYHFFSFPLVLFVTGTYFLKRSSGLLPMRYSGYDSWITPPVSWYSTNSRCRESHPYHEEPLFSCFFVALVAKFCLFVPLVCFCLLTTTTGLTIITEDKRLIKWLWDKM